MKKVLLFLVLSCLLNAIGNCQDTQFVLIFDATKGITTIPLSQIQSDINVGWPGPAAVSGVPLTDSTRKPYWSGVLTSTQLESFPAQLDILTKKIADLQQQIDSIRTAMQMIAPSYSLPLVYDSTSKIVQIQGCSSDNQLLTWKNGAWICTSFPDSSPSQQADNFIGFTIDPPAKMYNDANAVTHIAVDWPLDPLAVPLSSTSYCHTGEWTASQFLPDSEYYLYVCTSPNKWGRVQLSPSF